MFCHGVCFRISVYGEDSCQVLRFICSVALRDKYNAMLYDSQRDSWHRAHSIIWPTHLIISYLLPRSSYSAIASQCRWSSTTTAKLSSTYLVMRRHCGLRLRKWTLNRYDKIKRVPEQLRLRFASPKPLSQFASYLSHVRNLNFISIHFAFFCEFSIFFHSFEHFYLKSVDAIRYNGTHRQFRKQGKIFASIHLPI